MTSAENSWVPFPFEMPLAPTDPFHFLKLEDCLLPSPPLISSASSSSDVTRTDGCDFPDPTSSPLVLMETNDMLTTFNSQSTVDPLELALLPRVETPLAAAEKRRDAKRSSVFRGVTRHRWTGRYEAHLWDSTWRSEGRKRKGRQGMHVR